MSFVLVESSIFTCSLLTSTTELIYAITSLLKSFSTVFVEASLMNDGEEDISNANSAFIVTRLSFISFLFH